MVTSCTLLILSLVALYFGADWLVKGSSSLALKMKISPLVVGLTVVAFGTSTPELVVRLFGLAEAILPSVMWLVPTSLMCV